MSDATKTRMALECFTKGGEAVKRGDLDYAIEMFKACSKLVPDRLPFRQALRAAEKKKYKDNKKGAMGASIRMAPLKTKISYFKNRKRWTDMAVTAEEALHLNPWDSSTLVELATALKELEHIDSAVWVLETAAEIDKTTKSLYVFLAETYEQAALFDKSIKAWEMVKKIDPADHEAASKARQMAANSTIQRGKYEDAEGFKKQMLEANRADSGGNDTRTAAETPEKKARREIAALEQRIEQEPPTPSLYSQLGELYQRVDDFEKAAAAYKKALDASGGADFDLQTKIIYCQIEPVRNNLRILKERIESLDRQQPDAAEKEHKLKAQYNATNGELIRREIEMYRFRVSINPQDYASYYELGFRLLQMNLPDEAIRALQQARNDAQRKWESLYWLGYIFWQKKNFVLAEKNFADAFAEAPESNEEARKKILYYRGRLAEDKKDISAALEFYNNLASIDYGYKDVATRLDSLNAQAAS